MGEHFPLKITLRLFKAFRLVENFLEANPIAKNKRSINLHCSTGHSLVVRGVTDDQEVVSSNHRHLILEARLTKCQDGERRS